MHPVLISNSIKYRCDIFHIHEDHLNDGELLYTRHKVVHGGSSAVVPYFEDGSVALVRQYRYGAGKTLLEIPGGFLEALEDPITAANRELEEEIGVIATSVEKLCEFYVSPGFLTEKVHLYLATGLTHVGQKLESDELIELERYSLNELQTMITDGRICDAKTMIAIQMLPDHVARSAKS